MDFRALSLRNKGSTHGEDGEVLEIHRKSHRDFSIGCIARHDLVYNPPSLSSYRKSASKLVRGEMGAALRAVMRLLYIYTGMSRLFLVIHLLRGGVLLPTMLLFWFCPGSSEKSPPRDGIPHSIKYIRTTLRSHTYSLGLGRPCSIGNKTGSGRSLGANPLPVVG